jgi:hypothetical protein
LIQPAVNQRELLSISGKQHLRKEQMPFRKQVSAGKFSTENIIYSYLAFDAVNLNKVMFVSKSVIYETIFNLPVCSCCSSVQGMNNLNT